MLGDESIMITYGVFRRLRYVNLIVLQLYEIGWQVTQVQYFVDYNGNGPSPVRFELTM